TIRPDRVGSGRGGTVGEGERDALTILGKCGQLMAPARNDAELGEARDEQLLDLRLADVHEGREVVVAGAGQGDAEELAAAKVGAPDPPLHPAVGHALPDPEPVPALERLPLQ